MNKIVALKFLNYFQGHEFSHFRKEYLRKKRNDDYKKELEGYELWIREGEKISENEAMKEQRRLGRLLQLVYRQTSLLQLVLQTN